MKSRARSNHIYEIEKYFYSQGKNYLDKRIEDLKEIKNSLQDVKDANRLEKIQKIGHRIKGSAGLYGFSKLSEIGLRLEATAKSGDIVKLPNIVDEFQSFLNEATSEEK